MHMLSIDLLYQDMHTAPSLLSVSDELRFMVGVMALEPNDIARNSEVFFKILDHLEESHTAGWGYASEDPEAMKIFERFASFLEGLVEHIPAQKEWLSTAAENFRLRWTTIGKATQELRAVENLRTESARPGSQDGDQAS